jgi:DNA-directed RNA polymerase specialized sigma24 family protein
MAKEDQLTNEEAAAIVDGVYQHDPKMGTALYEVCLNYFKEYFHPITYVNDYDRDDIFQNSLETLLGKIEKRKIYAEDGELKGKDGKPFTGSLTTYFMGIAYLKYKEFFRVPPIGFAVDIDTGKTHQLVNDAGLYRDILYDDEENVTLSIIADCISKMSERCSQILSLFYYEKKNYDEILEIIPTYKSKNALKTEKNRCLNTLRDSVKTIYNNFFI